MTADETVALNSGGSRCRVSREQYQHGGSCRL
ncbi:hypothetical protein GMORB2_4533 [Geosmithia morbida]|uniref:Uncharacterized protein n=1 Tax=Geosmithia morbida TaxID=1094350 RepID=A0A9P4YRD0_9HYPO|nr:uncharacterized protein GMORB2_4533 [Geosmithia morbida]KAF4119624.1 hypothetical protein GMORB2_4533 [Geosmithia morbida]